MLLRLHTVGVAHVLSDDPPPPPPPPTGVKEEDGEATAAAAKKWARDDVVCRGHILAAFSDRIFPDYVRHGTRRAAWETLARTYDVDASRVARRMLYDLEFEGGGSGSGAVLLEQIAHAEALNSATMRFTLSDVDLAKTLCQMMLPAEVATVVINRSSADGAAMHDVWHVARIMEAQHICREELELHGKCGNCGESRRHGCNRMG